MVKSLYPRYSKSVLFSFVLLQVIIPATNVTTVEEDVDSAGKSALFKASAAGRITLVKNLIESGKLLVTILDSFLVYFVSE